MERGSIMRARELAVLRKSLAKLTRTQRQRLVAELVAELAAEERQIAAVAVIEEGGFKDQVQKVKRDDA